MSTKLDSWSKHMHDWDNQIKAIYRNQVDECRKEMERLREPFDEESAFHYSKMREKLNNLISQEELYLK